jgi:hypothetical protein
MRVACGTMPAGPGPEHAKFFPVPILPGKILGFPREAPAIEGKGSTGAGPHFCVINFCVSVAYNTGWGRARALPPTGVAHSFMAKEPIRLREKKFLGPESPHARRTTSRRARRSWKMQNGRLRLKSNPSLR